MTQTYVIGAGAPNQGGIEISDLTVDCSWTDFGGRLASSGSFIVPPFGATVTVPVSGTNWARVGQYAYIQRMDNYAPIGFYLIKSLPDSSHIVLENLQGTGDPFARGDNEAPPGTVVSGRVFAGPAVTTSPIAIGDRNCHVERVHVTNAGAPFYEGTMGILIGHNTATPADTARGQFAVAGGNLISNCVADNLWGTHGWVFTIEANNTGTNDDGTYISGTVANNIVHSNGYHQGLSIGGAENSVFINNKIYNCESGWFVDVAYQHDISITHNLFVDNRQAIMFGGGYPRGWERINVSQNKIVVPAGGGGIITTGNVFDCAFTRNLMLAEPKAAPRPIGFNIWNRAGTTTGSNTFANNVIDAYLINYIPAFAGRAHHNVNQFNRPMTMGSGAGGIIDDAFPKKAGY